MHVSSNQKQYSIRADCATASFIFDHFAAEEPTAHRGIIESDVTENAHEAYCKSKLTMAADGRIGKSNEWFFSVQRCMVPLTLPQLIHQSS